MTPPSAEFSDGGELLEISAYTSGGVHVALASGELDAFSSDVLVRHVEETAQADPAQVVLDLSALTFMDAGGLGAVVLCRRILTARAADMVLVCAGGPALRLLTLCGLEAAWRIYPTKVEALGGSADTDSRNRRRAPSACLVTSGRATE